ncbi:MAG: cyclic nucleotide-binding domain-containing protein, partial [Oscillospiraceae bacterium]|nr:cyclic nucleotide-binding domain-containing protein [Oscillospiraceae bacterium]
MDLSRTELFQSIAPEDLKSLLHCLDVRQHTYQKGEILFLEGAPTQQLGLVLSGKVIVEMGDPWGGRSILSTIGPGDTFAEAYACIPGEPLLVTVSAAMD